MSSPPRPVPNPSSEVSSHSHSQSESANSLGIHQYAPLASSGLRETQTVSASPEDTREDDVRGSGPECSPRTSPVPDLPMISAEGRETGEGLHRSQTEEESIGIGTSLLAQSEAMAGETSRETTPLLRRPIEFVTSHAHPGPCNHGTFSPRPHSPTSSIRSLDGTKSGTNSGGSRGIFESIADGLIGGGGSAPKKLSTTARLAEEHGIKTSSIMYVLCQVFWRSSKAIDLDRFSPKGSTDAWIESVSDKLYEQVLHILHSISCVD